MKIINPATEEVIKEIQEDTKETVDKKFQLLQAGQPQWAKTPVQKE